jgi:protein TonB
MERVTFEKDFLFAAIIALAIHVGIAFTQIPFISQPIHFKMKDYGHLNIYMGSTHTAEKKRLPVVPVVKKEKKIPLKEEKKIIKPIQKKKIMKSPSPKKVETQPYTTDAISRPPVTLAKGHPEMAKVILAVPRYSVNASPVYPVIARRREYEGVVLLSAEILDNGMVGKLKIKKSSGYHILDVSALKTVKKWKFEPAKKMGFPITMWVDVPIRFVLNDAKVDQ